MNVELVRSMEQLQNMLSEEPQMQPEWRGIGLPSVKKPNSQLGKSRVPSSGPAVARPSAVAHQQRRVKSPVARQVVGASKICRQVRSASPMVFDQTATRAKSPSICSDALSSTEGQQQHHNYRRRRSQNAISPRVDYESIARQYCAKAVSIAHEPLLSEMLPTPTIDATIIDMGTVLKRVAQSVQSLAKGRRNQQTTESLAVIEQDVDVDPQMRRVKELERSLVLVSADYHVQQHTITRLENHLAAREEEIRLLKQEVDEYLDRIKAMQDPRKSVQLDFLPIEDHGTTSGAASFRTVARQMVANNSQSKHPLRQHGPSVSPRRANVKSEQIPTFAPQRKGARGSVSATEFSAATYPSVDAIKAVTQMRRFGPAVYADQPPQGIGVTMLGMSVVGLDRFVSTNKDAATRAARMYTDVLDYVLPLHSAYPLQIQPEFSCVVFHNAVAACSCALRVQSELLKLDWPKEFEDDPEYFPASDETRDPPVVIWNGLRVAMALHLCENPPMLVRDLVTSRPHFVGSEPKLLKHLQAFSQGGMILLDEPTKEVVDAHELELDDPCVTFHCWGMVPLCEGAQRLWRVCCRYHALRNQDFDSALGRSIPPQLFRIVRENSLEPPTEVSVPGFDVIPNAALEKKGSRRGLLGSSRMSFSEPEVVGGALTMRARIAVSNWFREQSLPEDEPPSNLPSGDVCLALVLVPDVAEMSQVLDEISLGNYLRKFQTFVRVSAQSEGAVEISAHRDRLLFAFNDTTRALRFAMELHERAAASQWPDVAELHAFTAPRRWKGRIVKSGPSISVVIHSCRVTAFQPLFGQKLPAFSGDEIDLAAAMAAAASTQDVAYPCGCILISETVYAQIFFRYEELNCPVIEPCGIIEYPFETTPTLQSSPFCFAIFHVVPHSLECRHHVTQRQLLVDNGVTDKARITRTHSELRDHLGGLMYDATRCIPSTTALRSSIQNIATSRLATRLHFEREKQKAPLLQFWSFSYSMYQNSRHPRHRKMLESLEQCVMFTHDEQFASTTPAPEIHLDPRDLGDYSAYLMQAAASATPAQTPRGKPSPGATPTTLSLQPAFEDERKYFQAREMRTTAEVQAAHRIVEQYMSLLRQYLLPIVDESAAGIDDEDFITHLVDIVRKEREAFEEASQKPKKIGEMWRQLTSETADESDNSVDAVKAARSIVAHCCKHFLFIRTVSKRMNRFLEKAQRETFETKQLRSKMTSLAGGADGRTLKRKVQRD